MTTTDVIPPSEIHSELSRIWDSFEGTNKIRASLFNLIFFTKMDTRIDYIRTISQSVIEKFPARVIFIIEDSKADKEYLNTKVSVLTSSKGEFDIACDYIEITFSGKQQERVPFIILPQLLADLPVYVIWAEDPSYKLDLFKGLQKLATRMIFDSESSPLLSDFSRNLLHYIHDVHIDVADLNWARMESWRELLASTFYSPERLSILKKTTRIQILYNAEESKEYTQPKIQAIYLQGWLSSQLNWQFNKIVKEKAKLTFHYTRDGGSVVVELYPEWQHTLKPGIILSVDIETEDNNHFSFGRNLGMPEHISMRLSTLEKCDIPLTYMFSKDQTGRSLTNEICKRGTSKHFIHLLNLLKEINGI